MLTVVNLFDGILQPIEYAIDNNADIISLSLASPGKSLAVQDVIRYAASQNIITIAAAGNSGSYLINYPAGYPEVIGVSGNWPNNDRAGGSGYYWGRTSSFGGWVDVSAPWDTWTVDYVDGDYIYSQAGGTSISTPIVSGLAGLIKSVSNDMPSDELFSIIQSGVSSTNSTDYIGTGIVNASKALLLAQNSTFSSYPIAKIDYINYDENSTGFDIYGSAHVNSGSISNYEIWYGVGTYPSELTLLYNSTSMVVNGILSSVIPIVDNQITVELRVYQEDRGLYSFDSYYFLEPEGYLLENYNDFVLDFDEDGLYDKLIINSSVQINASGDYYATISLEDSDGTKIGTDSSFRNFVDPGIYELIFEFSGINIYNSKTNGPYIVKDIVLQGVTYDYPIYKKIDNASDVYITNNYSYNEFEHEVADEVGNIVRNPSFEIDSGVDYYPTWNQDDNIAGNLIPNGWGSNDYGENIEVRMDYNIKKDRDNSVKINANNARGFINQQVPIELGKSYQVSGWIKSNLSQGIGIIATHPVDANRNFYSGGPLDNFNSNRRITGDTDWTYFTFKLDNTDPNAKYLLVECWASPGISQLAIGDVWCDDFKVQQISEPSKKDPELEIEPSGRGDLPPRFSVNSFIQRLLDILF